jgi:hypothetical protein
MVIIYVYQCRELTLMVAKVIVSSPGCRRTETQACYTAFAHYGDGACLAAMSLDISNVIPMFP